MSESSRSNEAGGNTPASTSGQLHLPMDMSEIYGYEILLKEITRVNSLNGPLYMQELLRGKDLAANYLAKLTFDFEQSKNRTKQAYAVAYLEKSEDYIKAKGLKSTDETKKQYCQIDPNYKAAKDQEDMLKALVILMENKLDTMQAGHDDVKAIYRNQAEARGAGPALAQGKDSA